MMDFFGAPLFLKHGCCIFISSNRIFDLKLVKQGCHVLEKILEILEFNVGP